MGRVQSQTRLPGSHRCQLQGCCTLVDPGALGKRWTHRQVSVRVEVFFYAHPTTFVAASLLSVQSGQRPSDVQRDLRADTMAAATTSRTFRTGTKQVYL
jgi:hypothetical protein